MNVVSPKLHERFQNKAFGLLTHSLTFTKDTATYQTGALKQGLVQ